LIDAKDKNFVSSNICLGVWTMKRYLLFIIQFGLISRLEAADGITAYTGVQISIDNTTHIKEVAKVLERPLKDNFGEYSVSIQDNKLFYAFNSNNQVTKYKIEQIIKTSRTFRVKAVAVKCDDCTENESCEVHNSEWDCVSICKDKCPEGFGCKLDKLEIICEKLNATNSDFTILIVSIGITSTSLGLIVWVYNKLELNDEEIKRQKLKRINKELSQVDVEYSNESRSSQVSFNDKVTREARKSLQVIKE